MTSKITSLFFIILIIICLSLFLNFLPSTINDLRSNPSPVPTGSSLGQTIKNSDCRINGPLPDHDCTPGAVFPDATKDQICQRGYSASVRDVSVDTKNEVYRDYGITSHPQGTYEIDHLISLELGGSNDLNNLWPEAALPVPGFHQKDELENYLHDQVCRGQMDLATAQHLIATDWLSTYDRIFGYNK